MSCVCVCISDFMRRARLPLESSSLDKGLPDFPIVRPCPLRPSCTVTPWESHCTKLKWKVPVTTMVPPDTVSSILCY